MKETVIFAVLRHWLGIAVAICVITSAASAVAADVPVRLSDLYASLNEVALHARSFPPKFSSAEEKAQVEDHLKSLLTKLDKISDRYPDDKEILFIKGSANAMGHNLDFAGCSEKAMTSFERLLSLDPNNRRANYEYGAFLSGTTLIEKSIPYLKRSIELGEDRAHYTLAFAFLKSGDMQKALPEFEAYLKVDPDNATAKKFVDDIKSGKESFHVVHHDASEGH